MEEKIKLLDCTLRDGGYVNGWKFGKHNIKEIIRDLVKAGVDIVEVGFLRKADDYLPSEDVTRWEDVHRIKECLPEEKGGTLFSAMCIHNFYDTALLPESGQCCIDMLRVTFHNYDYKEGLAFCKRAMEKGYRVSCNPINIMGYGDTELLELLEAVNRLHPYAFSIVDTFGSMMQKDLDRLVSLVEHNLEQEIRLGLHLHENLSQSFSLAQKFLNKHLHREVIIDGSLMGMGRIPGNLSLELIANYLNEDFDKAYDIDCMLDTIEDHIAPLQGANSWGYTPTYFLSAKYNLHRNYAEHYLRKGNLTHRDINHILSRIPESKKAAFHEAYADAVYEEYLRNHIDDSGSRAELKKALAGRELLVVAPGKTIALFEKDIQNVIETEKPAVIFLNFMDERFGADYVFFSNHKRYEKYIDGCSCPVIATSNIVCRAEYRLDYNSLAGAFRQGCNSLVMLLRLFSDLGIGRVMLAGADGYRGGDDYFDSSIHSFTEHSHNFNYSVASAIRRQGVEVRFLTPSCYDIGGEG